MILRHGERQYGSSGRMTQQGRVSSSGTYAVWSLCIFLYMASVRFWRDNRLWTCVRRSCRILRNDTPTLCGARLGGTVIHLLRHKCPHPHNTAAYPLRTYGTIRTRGLCHGLIEARSAFPALHEVRLKCRDSTLEPTQQLSGKHVNKKFSFTSPSIIPASGLPAGAACKEGVPPCEVATSGTT